MTAIESIEQRPAGVVLWERFAESRDLAVRDQLILQYGPLVKYVIGKLPMTLPALFDYDDILSYGTIGLIEAVERFDQTKGVKFETYAISRVRGAIIDALRAQDRLPRSLRRKAREADAATSRLAGKFGRIPTHQEVAEELGIPLHTYLRDKADTSRLAVSLETAAGVDEREIQIADLGIEDVGESMVHSELIGDLAEAIRALPDREQLIMSCYYEEELTMREISKVLGVSESRVCQLHARALTNLRTGIERLQKPQAA